MQCHKCQHLLQSDYLFCPHCGIKVGGGAKAKKRWKQGVFLTLFLLMMLFLWNRWSEEGSFYNLVKEENNEKFGDLLLAAAPGTTSGEVGATIGWLLPIDIQLRSFREKNIALAYNETVSKEFKAVTSLEEFTQFVEKYPILFTHSSVSIKSQSFQNNEADITVLLNPDTNAIPVHYLLINEEGKWKVWSMNITPTYSEAVNRLLSDFSAMRKPVEGLMQALKNGENPKAYQQFTSKTFRESTTQDAFRNFLRSFPVMSDYTAAEFKEPIIDKTTVLLDVNLYDKFGTTLLEYTLGIEEDQWKIWGIRVLEQTPEHALSKKQSDGSQNTDGSRTEENTSEVSPKQQSVASLDFYKVEVGTGLDLSGNIADPVTRFKSPHGDIYVNVFVRNGSARIIVTVGMEHVESHSMLPEVSTTLQQDGDAMLSFSFVPPPQGWPKGNYKIKVNSSTGISHTFTFTIE